MKRFQWLRLLALLAWLDGGDLTHAEHSDPQAANHIGIEISNISPYPKTDTGTPTDFPYGGIPLQPMEHPGAYAREAHGLYGGTFNELYRNSHDSPWEPFDRLGIPILLAILAICLLGCVEHKARYRR